MFHIAVGDVDKSMKFYVESLGFTVTKD